MTKMNEFVCNTIIDKILDLLIDMSIEDIKSFMTKKNYPKMLLKSFQKVLEKISNDNEKRILDFPCEKIDPCFTIEQLRSNLESLFDSCITMQDKEKQSEIELKICANYKQRAAVTLDLSHILANQQESTLKLLQEIQEVDKKASVCLNNTNGLLCKTEKVSQNLEIVISNLKKNSQTQLYFIDELENSKIYYYIELCLTKPLSASLYNEFETTLEIGMGDYELYEDNQGFSCLYLEFIAPMCQSDLRNVLRALDKTLSKEDIGVLRIWTHE